MTINRPYPKLKSELIAIIRKKAGTGDYVVTEIKPDGRLDLGNTIWKGTIRWI